MLASTSETSDWKIGWGRCGTGQVEKTSTENQLPEMNWF